MPARVLVKFIVQIIMKIRWRPLGIRAELHINIESRTTFTRNKGRALTEHLVFLNPLPFALSNGGYPNDDASGALLQFSAAG